MKVNLPLALIALAVLLAAPRCGKAEGEGNAAAPGREAAAGGPVVVELFTSQGCSSCPPADRLLTELGQDSALAGRVFPLAYHVDYWNYIGWEDPFSSDAWSQRQSRYARALGNGNRIYTPQLVVNGRADCVGSNVREARAKIRAALKAEPAGRVTLRLAPAIGTLGVAVEAAVAKAAERDLDLLVALYQKDLTTPVSRGENAQRTLHNDYVVRRLQKAFSLAPGSRRTGKLTLQLDRAWDRADLGVVAFLQDPVTLEIHGAAAQPLARAGS